MGCGISKYGLADQAGPLRRTLEELRRDIADSTPSTKLLTKGDGGGEDSPKSTSASRLAIKGEVGERREKDGDNKQSEDDEEEGRISDYDASLLWMRSPSFREYCTNEDCDLDDSSKDDDSSDGEEKQIKPQGDKFHAPPQSNEEPATKSIRKGGKGRRFRKVFSTGKPSGMRNLFHAAASNNPNNVSASHDKLRKPVDKSV